MNVCTQVSAAHVTRLDLIPDIDSSSLSVLVHGSDSADGLAVQVDIYFPQNGTAVCTLHPKASSFKCPNLVSPELINF